MRAVRDRALITAILAAFVAGGAACSTSPATPVPSVAATSVPTSAVPVERAADDASGPGTLLPPVAPGQVTLTAGVQWGEPAWIRPAVNSGFFSEQASPADHVAVRAVDQTWRQLMPSRGALVTNQVGTAQDMSFDSLDDQLSRPGPFWMRLFASGADWAPTWVATDCHVHGYGPDYDGQRHLPIWDECVWAHLLDTYRAVFVDRGLRADPRLRFVYVPGAFTWAEFDYETVAAAVEAGDLTFQQYHSWYAHAWRDLASLFGPYADKLVFTGEDYPFGPFTPAQQDLLAVEATEAGIGIRNGITEEFNFHLSEAPAYGSSIQPDGHLVVDESIPLHDGRHVVATENECYTDCGFTTDDVRYAVEQSNLKALQLRMNWVYVVPDASRLTEYAAVWDFVRLSLGHTAADSADAWADLRDAQDTYWDDAVGRFATPAAWRTKPYVRNLERWLVQRDVPGGVARRASVDVRRHVFAAENGTAYEGLSTDAARGETGLYFALDPGFASHTQGPVQVLVTFWDRTGVSFDVRYAGGSGHTATVRATGTGGWRTAAFTVPDARFAGSLTGGTDLEVHPAGGDLVVKFVRVVRLAPPS